MNASIRAHLPEKLVIVGGVAGGMSAAARARRLSERSEIIVIEKSGYVSFANCGLPYYIGGEIAGQDKLILQTPASLKARFNLDVRVGQEVIDIDARGKVITVRNLESGETYQESYDDLILSVGASPVKPPLPGINLPGVFTVRSIEDVAAIETWIKELRPVNAVVAGCGFIGMEMAEQLKRRGLNVTMIDAQDQVLKPLDREMADLVRAELEKQGIDLRLGCPLKALRPPASDGNAASPPQSSWVQAGDGEPIAADLVILGLGVKPDVSLARKAGIVIGERGGIRVNERLQTSDPHIFAVGDAIEVRHPVSQEWRLISLGGPANRQGRIAAGNIFGFDETYDGTLGTAIVRVFSLTAAVTGLSEADLRSSTTPYEVVHLHPSNHAGYYPGAQRIDLKVIFARTGGNILGAQAVGQEGVDKRIDILATAIKAGMTVRDLADLELAYAPPFGSAKDPINLAGMIGENILDGLVEQVQWHELGALPRGQVCLLDVREASERQRGCIPDSIHIPLGQLRQRLSEIPADQPVVAYCQSGQRSYFASRLLSQEGFKVKNLAGAYITWKAAVN